MKTVILLQVIQEGNVFGSSIYESYVGGLIGNNRQSNITSSYALGDSHSSNTLLSYLGGLIGRNIEGDINQSYVKEGTVNIMGENRREFRILCRWTCGRE